MPIRMTAKISSASLGGAANVANVTFAFGAAGPTTIQDLAGKVIAYLRVAASVQGVSSSIDGISYSALPAGPTVQIPFPVAEFSTEYFRLTPVAQAGISGVPAYNQETLGVAARRTIARGSSLCMTENTLTEASAGRHYLPDTSGHIFSTDGTVLSNIRAAMVANWEGAFLGNTNTVWATASIDSEVGVWSPTNLTFTELAGVSCAALGSLLQSRKR